MSEQEFFCETILGMDTGKALVKVTFMGQEMMVESDQAKEMANVLLETAHASEMDRALFRFLTEEQGMAVNLAAVMIRGLREFRS